MESEACGYCFFNNVAGAAKHAIENLGVERLVRHHMLADLRRAIHCCFL